MRARQMIIGACTLAGKAGRAHIPWKSHPLMYPSLPGMYVVSPPISPWPPASMSPLATTISPLEVQHPSSSPAVVMGEVVAALIRNGITRQREEEEGVCQLVQWGWGTTRDGGPPPPLPSRWGHPRLHARIAPPRPTPGETHTPWLVSEGNILHHSQHHGSSGIMALHTIGQSHLVSCAC